MDQQMLEATQQAAWAAQSAAEAAWWALLIGGIASVATVGALIATIILATRADRESRKRDTVFFQHAVQTMGSALIMVGEKKLGYFDYVENLVQHHAREGVRARDIFNFNYELSWRQWQMKRLEESRIFERLGSIDRSRFHDPSMLSIFGAGYIALEMLAFGVGEANNSISTLEEDHAKFRDCVIALSDELRKLRPGVKFYE